jgi:glycerol-3-phosphate acyltransferase PlsX
LSNITIAIDAMGGDYGCAVTLPAVVNALQEKPNVQFILVGDRKKIETFFYEKKLEFSERLRIHHAPEIVAMDEPPAQALRFKKNSSMRLAIDLVKEGEADACVSAGNTGALMVTARFVLKTLPGIDRPAICSQWPTMQANKFACILDLGANVDCTPEQLFQFAVMGTVLSAGINGIENPTVALLNIGSEDIKGNEQVKRAAELLEQCSALNYIGFIEGTDIFQAKADVVVCDGFVGNVALKASEGVAKLFRQVLVEEFKNNFLTKMSALMASYVLNRFRKRIDPARYNGATFLGLRGTVIKSHGGTNILGFQTAINQALLQVNNNVPERISAEVERILMAE